MKTQPELTEFDELLDGLGARIRSELAEASWHLASGRTTWPSFVVFASGLSIEALRFVSARPLLRKATRHGWRC